jgi:hypothetical protein
MVNKRSFSACDTMSDIPANVVAAFKEFPGGDSIGVIQEYAWVHLTRGDQNFDGADLKIEHVPTLRACEKRVLMSFWRRGKCMRACEYVHGEYKKPDYICVRK